MTNYQRTFYIHTNARGDVVCVTDDTMNWVKRYAYDPWGRITSETASSPEYDALFCPYAYAGYFRDPETGLYYMPAMYYSPTQRRFLTKDPHPGSRSNPLTLNPYQYCVNNPVNKVDPTGQYHVSFDFSMLSGSYDLKAIDNALALIREGGRQAAGFASSMAGFRSSVQGSMANMGSLGGIIRSGASTMLSGISGLASFNRGSLAAVGVGGGITKAQAASDRGAYLKDVRNNPCPWPPSKDPRNLLQKAIHAVFFNPITRTVVGVVGAGVSILAVPKTFGISLKGLWFSYKIIDFAIQDMKDGNWLGNPYHNRR